MDPRCLIKGDFHCTGYTNWSAIFYRACKCNVTQISHLAAARVAATAQSAFLNRMITISYFLTDLLLAW